MLMHDANYIRNDTFSKSLLLILRQFAGFFHPLQCTNNYINKISVFYMMVFLNEMAEVFWCCRCLFTTGSIRRPFPTVTEQKSKLIWCQLKNRKQSSMGFFKMESIHSIELGIPDCLCDPSPFNKGIPIAQLESDPHLQWRGCWLVSKRGFLYPLPSQK